MSKEKITRGRVFEIIAGYEIIKPLTGIKLAYAISRNMRELKKEKELVQEMDYKSDKLKEYQDKYSAILEKEAKRDAEGNYVAAGGGQIALQNLASFKAKVKKLDEEYAEELAAKKAQDEKIEAFLKDEFEFDFYTFDQELLPDSITVEQYELITEMVAIPAQSPEPKTKK